MSRSEGGGRGGGGKGVIVFVEHHARSKRVCLPNTLGKQKKKRGYFFFSRESVGSDAFPTILVFRKDDTGKSEHESYHGERSIPAITGWAENFVKQIKREIPKTRTVDSDKDGPADSHTGKTLSLYYTKPLSLYDTPRDGQADSHAGI